MSWYLSDTNLLLLMIIHSPNIVTLWNAQKGTKIWRVVFDNDRSKDTETLLQIIQDPFNHKRAICNYKVFFFFFFFFLNQNVNLTKTNIFLFSTWSVEFNIYR